MQESSKCSRIPAKLSLASIDGDIADYAKMCPSCITHKLAQAQQPMLIKDIPDGLWQEIAADCFPLITKCTSSFRTPSVNICASYMYTAPRPSQGTTISRVPSPTCTTKYLYIENSLPIQLE